MRSQRGAQGRNAVKKKKKAKTDDFDAADWEAVASLMGGDNLSRTAAIARVRDTKDVVLQAGTTDEWTLAAVPEGVTKRVLWHGLLHLMAELEAVASFNVLDHEHKAQLLECRRLIAAQAEINQAEDVGP
jgi:hypothetical protein